MTEAELKEAIERVLRGESTMEDELLRAWAAYFDRVNPHPFSPR